MKDLNDYKLENLEKENSHIRPITLKLEHKSDLKEGEERLATHGDGKNGEFVRWNGHGGGCEVKWWRRWRWSWESLLEERESESEVSEEVMKVSYVWGFIVVSNFGIIAQRVVLVFGKG